MSIKTKAIIINAAIAATLLIESHYQPLWAIAAGAAILLPVANVALAIKAWQKRRA